MLLLSDQPQDAQAQLAGGGRTTHDAVEPPSGAAVAAIAGLAALTLGAAVGYATFGRHPELVGAMPGAASVYAAAFRIAPLLHMASAALALVVLLQARVGFRWAGGFALVYAISLCAELLGTTAGVPFGSYAYDRSLAPFWFGHVPVVIPLSWFTMALPAYALAARRWDGVWMTVLTGCALLVAWDLVLDPAMSGATTYWRWQNVGDYYGMPWINLVGWFLTGLALMGALEACGARSWLASIPARQLRWIYALQFLLPASMAAAAGFWGALAAAGSLLAVLWAAGALRPAAEPRVEPPSPIAGARARRRSRVTA